MFDSSRGRHENTQCKAGFLLERPTRMVKFRIGRSKLFRYCQNFLLIIYLGRKYFLDIFFARGLKNAYTYS